MRNNLASSYLTISTLNPYALQSETGRYQHNENMLTTQSVENWSKVIFINWLKLNWTASVLTNTGINLG